MFKKNKIITPGSLVHQRNWAELTRRQMLAKSASFTSYLGLSSLFGSRDSLSQSSLTVQRRLVWISMNGGWDILETTDPKRSSTSGIDMSYDFGLAHSLNGSDERIGRWMTNLARDNADELVVVRGLAMGTTSHAAGTLYMDTGILSNSAEVNVASIPAIVAANSADTIPIIVLNGATDVLTDKGIESVSVVRANNLELYQSLYPSSSAELSQKLLILDHLRASAESAETLLGVSDRYTDIQAAEAKVRAQFEGDVGSKLSLTNEDIQPFLSGAPTNMNSGQRDNFALALKLLKNNLTTCINMGVGGFDTHSNQEQRLQPTLESFDFLLNTFVNELKLSGNLDNTLIVCFSDFGRTPKINGNNGRDHWPVGGAMLLGGRIDGGRFVGATDDDLRALNVSKATGLVDAAGEQLNPTHLGGSVLDLCLGSSSLDSRPYLESVPALVQLRSS